MVLPERKPLVFISATRTDHDWRDRLRTALLAYTDSLDWWDVSDLKGGEVLQSQVDYAIELASLAAVFLSSAYLSSETATSELIKLGGFTKVNKLKLFPILLEECEWQRHAFLKEVQIWNNARPIGNLSREEADLELEKIAAAIRDLLVPIPSTGKSQELSFSGTSKDVLAHAWALAKETNRGRITSSCLLFAMADNQNSSFGTTPTPQFARKALNENGFYEREFEAFLKDGEPSITPVVSMPGIPFRTSQNLAAILKHSVEIATNVNGGYNQVHTRHLFATLITPKFAGSWSLRDRLQRLELDLTKLRADFRKLVSSIAPHENASQWDEVLGITHPPKAKPDMSEPEAVVQTVSAPDLPSFKLSYSAFIPDRASYGRRAPGDPLDDSLGVRTYAGHLAQLIAAKETFMPLSIGLFGAWGAGKSYFMDLLEEQLRGIAKDPGQAFHNKIVQIRFNAWHYLDTNLWANLVSEIFDQLFNSLKGPNDEETKELQALKSRLAEQSALAAEANEALIQAQIVRKKAENELREAMQKRAEDENKVSTLLDDLMNLPITNEVKNQLREVAKGLGLPKVESSFKELEARAAEVRSLAGRIKALILALFTGPGWWKRSLLLIIALAAPLAVSWLAMYGTPWIKESLAGAGRTILQVVTVIATLSTWLATQVRAGNSLVGKLESTYDQVTKVRTQREAQDDAAKAQAALAQKRQTEEEARHKLHEAEEKLKTISAELAEMAPGRQLIRFLRQRATAEDYRRHLGLVSLVRKDFEQLSNLFTSESNDKDLPKIDRIVLYIDDLDRCGADRVIEVLEAVHLLLAFPLFAVVVAVDPRWLRQSLLDHYPRLLGGSEDGGANPRAGLLGRPATPQDYLEKIFQVPFNLQAMEKTGYESLVKHLFTVDGSRPKDSQALIETPLLESREQLPETPAPEPVKIHPDVSVSNVMQVPPANIKTPISAPAPEPVRLDPERLVLTQKEVDDVQRFQLLFQTPRAVKRLANTYSLIRVGVDEKQWPNYLGTDNSPCVYRVPLLLLAVTSAFPSLARPWLLWLRETPPTRWQLEENDLKNLADRYSDTTDLQDWERLRTCLNRMDLDGWTPPDIETLAEWVPRVARYSFS